MNVYYRCLLGLGVAGTLQLASCSTQPTNQDQTMTNEQSTAASALADVHSYARPAEAVAKHLNLDLTVDFDRKVLTGQAAYLIENKTGANEIIFDTRDLHIEQVLLGDELKETTFRLGEGN